MSNVPVYGTQSVAQFVFAVLLELCQHVAKHAEAVTAGEWTSQPDFSLRKTPLIELAGKTMGIVGFGRIGRRVGELARAFGMSVLAYDLFPPTAPAEGPVTWCELDDLFARSDVISLHCPLTPQTAGLVNRERLRLVKPSAFLINTARGALVVEKDLAEALNAGRLAGAAVDVVSQEPIRPDNPLRGARNCLITPHIAWATTEARARLMEATVANVSRVPRWLADQRGELTPMRNSRGIHFSRSFASVATGLVSLPVALPRLEHGRMSMLNYGRPITLSPHWIRGDGIPWPRVSSFAASAFLPRTR